MSKKLYIGNLSYETSEAALVELFGATGDVVSANIIRDRDTGRSRGFGFVEMGTQREAQLAISQLNGKELDGRMLRVNEARPREEQGGRRGGGRRGSRW